MNRVKTIEWTGRGARIIDQTLLPTQTKFLTITDERQMWEAIRKLRVRGAPAIGVAAAYGFYLGIARKKPRTIRELKKVAAKVREYLASSRPTAVNLFWALDRCTKLVESLDAESTVKEALARLLDLAKQIHREDEETCELIGKHGAKAMPGVTGILTHCNAGALATAGIGTALSVIYTMAAKSESLLVYVDETRPLLQGARLTAWELQRAGIDTRLITDNMAGTVLQKGLVQAVITGADRIAANGDTANKVGTMPLAIVASFYKIPFFVAAPLSTFDPNIKTGSDIPIEERGSEEITHFGARPVAPKGQKTFAPAFDVTPAKLIHGIITEKGVLRPPFKQSIAQALRA